MNPLLYCMYYICFFFLLCSSVYMGVFQVCMLSGYLSALPKYVFFLIIISLIFLLSGKAQIDGEEAWEDETILFGNCDKIFCGTDSILLRSLFSFYKGDVFLLSFENLYFDSPFPSVHILSSAIMHVLNFKACYRQLDYLVRCKNREKYIYENTLFYMPIILNHEYSVRTSYTLRIKESDLKRKTVKD